MGTCWSSGSTFKERLHACTKQFASCSYVRNRRNKTLLVKRCTELRPMFCQFRLPTINITRAFEASTWGVGSTSGGMVGIAPVAEGPTVDGGRLTIPLRRADDKGNVVERAVARGWGVGVGMSGGIQIPFVDFHNAKMPLKNAPIGGSGSTTQMPGVGSPIFSGLGSKNTMQAKDWDGACIVVSGSAAFMGASAGPSVIVFMSRSCLSLTLPPPAQLALIRGIAFTFSTGLAAALASAGVDALIYDLHVKSEAAPRPMDPVRRITFQDWDVPRLTFHNWDLRKAGGQ